MSSSPAQLPAQLQNDEKSREIAEMAMQYSPPAKMPKFDQQQLDGLTELHGSTATINASASSKSAVVSQPTDDLIKCSFHHLEPEEVCIIAIQTLLLKGERWNPDELIEHLKQLKAISLYFAWALDTCLRILPITIAIDDRAAAEIEFSELLDLVPQAKCVKSIDFSTAGNDVDLKIVQILRDRSIKVKGIRLLSLDTSVKWKPVLEYCMANNCRFKFIYGFMMIEDAADGQIQQILSLTNAIRMIRLVDVKAETMKIIFAKLADSNVLVGGWVLSFRNEIGTNWPLVEMRRYFAAYPPMEIFLKLSIDTCHRLLSIFNDLEMRRLTVLQLPKIREDQVLSTEEKHKLRQIIRTSLKIATKVEYRDENLADRFGDDQFYQSVFSLLEEQQVQEFVGKLWLSNRVRWGDLKRHRPALGKIGSINMVELENETGELEARQCLEFEFGIEVESVFRIDGALQMDQRLQLLEGRLEEMQQQSEQLLRQQEQTQQRLQHVLHQNQ